MGGWRMDEQTLLQFYRKLTELTMTQLAIVKMLATDDMEERQAIFLFLADEIAGLDDEDYEKGVN